MKKYLLFPILGLQLILVSNVISFANNTPQLKLVIFGDSLSDTGNFPEPNNYIIQTKKIIPPSNLYVPFSNPQAFTPKAIYHIYGNTWHYPSNAFLKRSSNHSGLINHQKKHLYSLGWANYLTYNKTDTPLIPWSKIHTTPHPERYSINYAFAGALSINGFSNYYDYKKMKYVSEKTLHLLKNAYQKGQMTSHELPIPGLLRQIQFYLQDIPLYHLQTQSKHIIYIIYIGANDIARSMHKLIQGNIFEYLNGIGAWGMNGTITDNVSYAIKRLISQANAKHILLISSFDLANTVTAYQFTSNPTLRKIIKTFISSAVYRYNQNLQSIANEHSKIVTYVPLGEKLDQIALTPPYKAHILNGKSCINTTPNAQLPNPNVAHNWKNCRGYFNWNNSHFTNRINQETAYFIARFAIP